jgi:methylmalonyl-CoA mutase cobalamin-binding subunit
MERPTTQYRQAIDQLASDWISSGLPSRQGLDQTADELLRLRERLGIPGLWSAPPLMVTATLDDGLGQGLAVIEKYALVIGIRLISLGLMQPPEAIVAACRRKQPKYLGMTVLQFDSEDDLMSIADNLPTHTRIIAGGPVFSSDPEFAERTGTHYAAKNVAYFLRFMLDAIS